MQIASFHFFNLFQGFLVQQEWKGRWNSNKNEQLTGETQPLCDETKAEHSRSISLADPFGNTSAARSANGAVGMGRELC